LSELPGFTPHDRVLVVAPHPDDESIATGGLLQAAQAAGAARRVLLVTDGDNNPWPQRWHEKRWHVGPAERARWGARRRSEALAALQMLGVAPADVSCLGLPDLGLTDALMCGAPDVVALLLAQIEEFQPTRLVLPVLEDRHPDHSALDVLLRLALLRYSGAIPQLIAFGVHGAVPPEEGAILTLSQQQCDIKRAAIQIHMTQMLLSRKRFIAYAQLQEPFRLPPWPSVPNALHPLRAEVDAGGRLTVHIDQAKWQGSVRKQTLFVVMQGSDKRPSCYRIALTGAAADVQDERSGLGGAQATVEHAAAQTIVTVTAVGAATAGWVKLGHAAPGLFVFDRIGWQTVSFR